MKEKPQFDIELYKNAHVYINKMNDIMKAKGGREWFVLINSRPLVVAHHKLDSDGELNRTPLFESDTWVGIIEKLTIAWTVLYVGTRE